MTSKNLSFKLMAEDLKRRVWAIALTVLALIFAQIFPIAVKCSEYAEQAGKWNESPVYSVPSSPRCSLL